MSFYLLSSIFYLLSSIFYLLSSILDPRSSILDPRSSILDPRSSIVSVCAQQQNGEFANLPCVQVESVGPLRGLVAAGAFDARVAPFVGMFVLKLHLFQCLGEVAFQAIVARFGAQMFGRGGPHRFGLIPGRQPPQAAYD